MDGAWDYVSGTVGEIIDSAGDVFVAQERAETERVNTRAEAQQAAAQAKSEAAITRTVILGGLGLISLYLLMNRQGA